MLLSVSLKQTELSVKGKAEAELGSPNFAAGMRIPQGENSQAFPETCARCSLATDE